MGCRLSCSAPLVRPDRQRHRPARPDRRASPPPSPQSTPRWSATSAPSTRRSRCSRTIPGVAALAAEVIVSEIGPDMDRFPTAGHLLSWAGLCPRKHESAGKRRSTRLGRRTLAEDRPRASRLGRALQQAQLPPGLVPPPARPPRRQKGHLRRRRLHAHRRLPHAHRRRLLRRSRPDHFRRSEPITRAKALARQIERLGFRCSILAGPVSI